MSASPPDPPPTDGFLAGLFERLPEAWREWLTETFDLDPAQVEWLGEESARVSGNLLQLLEQGWPEMVAVAVGTLLMALGGAVLVGASAAIVGWLLYLVTAGPLLRRGWGSGRLIGCCAASLVFLCSAWGGAWAGLWLGAGRASETAIEQRYVIERTAAATFLAFALERDELPREMSPEQVDGLLENAQRRSADAWAVFRQRAAAAGEREGDTQPWSSPRLMVGVLERLGDGAPDLALLHRVLSAPDEAAGEGALPQTAGIRRRAVGLVRGTVYTQVATGLGFGLALPLIGLVLVGLLGVLLHRQAEPSGESS